MTAKLKGVLAASLTPIKPDGRPDIEALLAHSRWLLQHGCDAVAPLGTTGEANSIPLEDRLEVIDAAGRQLGGDKVLIGTGACALADAVRLTKAALAAGCSRVLVLPPFYYKTVTDDGLFAFFDQLIQKVGSSQLQMYVYHFPQQAVVVFSHALIERLIKAYPSTVVGCKDSSGDWAHTESLCKAFPGWGTFAGTETLLLQTLQAGGAGCISASANITAPLAREVYDVWSRGGDSKPLQDFLTKARLTLQKYPMIAALKTLNRRRTGSEGWRTLLPPNMPLTADQEKALMADLQAIGFFDRLGDVKIAAS